MSILTRFNHRFAEAACSTASSLFLLTPVTGIAQSGNTLPQVEYRVYGTPIYTMEKKLNVLAVEGWHLHSTMPVPPGSPCRFDNGQDAKDCVFLILEKRPAKAASR